MQKIKKGTSIPHQNGKRDRAGKNLGIGIE
jgi:hypothetical protein